jgi:hypothetical protein
MERKQALALASAATAVVGGGIVAAAALSGASILGFGGRASAHDFAAVTPVVAQPAARSRVVVRTKNVYDRIVVATTSTPTAARSSQPNVGSTVPAPVLATTPTTAGATRPATEPNRSDDGASGPSSTVAPPSDDVSTTVPPSPPTTVRGPEIPDDWPAGKPIPPIPPNCHEAELHLNGVWECSGPGD